MFFFSSSVFSTSTFPSSGVVASSLAKTYFLPGRRRPLKAGGRPGWAVRPAGGQGRAEEVEHAGALRLLPAPAVADAEAEEAGLKLDKILLLFCCVSFRGWKDTLGNEARKQMDKSKT